jgi:hypothetical protein
MALTAIEQLFDANEIETDYQGKSAASRRFVVATTDKQAAILADGIPAISSSHPDFPDLKLDTYAVTIDTAGVAYVSCRYSNDRRFGSSRQPNKDNPAWYWWGWSMRAAEVEIPIWRRERIAAAGNAAGSKLVYRIGKIIRVEYRVVRPLKVRVLIDNVRDLDVIAQQTNKIHEMPDGLQYLFTGGNVSQVDDAGNYDISYEWERDEGTTYFPDFPPGENAGYCDGELNRRNYTIFYAWQDGDPSTTKPKMRTIEQYDFDADGWRSLPGASRII